MSIVFRSRRVGKGGKPFTLYKIRTLRENASSPFAHENGYTWCGRFLRKYRLDESLQVWNILKGDMKFVGIRPLEERTVALYPEHIRDRLLSIKPGWFSLSGIYFMNEENILALSDDPHRDYWERIFPLKTTLDFFYLENRCLSLDLWIVWQGCKRAILQMFRN